MSKDFIAYATPSIKQADIDAVAAVLRSGMLTTGPTVDAFEAAFTNLSRASHAVSCSNGTTALYLIAIALGLDSHVSVIVPSITFLASASAFAMCGAEIVFADVDPVTGLVTPEAVESAAGRATRPVAAAVVVHLGGRLVDLPAMAALAEKGGFHLIEDACHAAGTAVEGGNGHAIGDCRYSKATAFSFHPTKTITCGEGGMVTTADAGLADRLRLLRNHGMSRKSPFVDEALALDPVTGRPNPWFYEMTACSLNFRLSDLHAAVGLSQLSRFDRIRAERHALRQIYDRGIESVPHCRAVAPGRPESAVDHLYQVAIDFGALGKTRAEIMDALRNEGVGTQVHYIPVHRQPYYRERSPNLRLEGADAFYASTLSLPFHNAMTTADAERVVEALRKVLSR